jgi:hypothetical protein
MEQRISRCITPRNPGKEAPVAMKDEPLIERADALLAETARLREAHQVFRAQVQEQVDRMNQIEAELDPLLPHPPWELATVRALLQRGRSRDGISTQMSVAAFSEPQLWNAQTAPAPSDEEPHEPA